jgi:hypothetical protein
MDALDRRTVQKMQDGLATLSWRRREPPGALAMRSAVWGWFRQVLSDQERSMVRGFARLWAARSVC